MNLRHIEAMIALVHTGTVGRAAQRLRISQPAVSKILKNIEQQTGLKLFERTKGRLALTEDAMLLYDEMERVYDGIVRLNRFAEAVRTLRYGALRIGVMPALSVGFIQDVLRDFLEDRPTIQVSIHARSSQKVAEWVIGGHLDVGFTSHIVDHPEISWTSVCAAGLVCAMPKGHCLETKEVIEPADLDGEDFVSFTRDNPIRTVLDEVFDQAGIDRNLVWDAPMAPTVLASVAHGLGVSILCNLFVGSFGAILTTRPFRPSFQTQVRLIVPSQRRLSSITQSFIAEASDYLRLAWPLDAEDGGEGDHLSEMERLKL